MALDLNFAPFSGVGITTIYKRSTVTGLPSGGGFDLGEVSKLDIGGNAPKVELNTSRSADRGVAFSMAQSKSGTVAIEMRTLDDYVLSLLTNGTWTEANASAAVPGWTAPNNLVAGQTIKLPHQNVSVAANGVTDSASTPAPLTAGTHYDLDAVGGTIKLTGDLSGFTQPFKVDYTPGAVRILGGLKAVDEDFILHFNGTNAHNGERVVLEVYRFRPAPEGAISMIQTEYGTFQLAGSIQKDETKSASSAGGQYYKIVKPGA